MENFRLRKKNWGNFREKLLNKNYFDFKEEFGSPEHSSQYANDRFIIK